MTSPDPSTSDPDPLWVLQWNAGEDVIGPFRTRREGIEWMASMMPSSTPEDPRSGQVTEIKLMPLYSPVRLTALRADTAWPSQASL